MSDEDKVVGSASDESPSWVHVEQVAVDTPAEEEVEEDEQDRIDRKYAHLEMTFELMDASMTGSNVFDGFSSDDDDSDGEADRPSAGDYYVPLHMEDDDGDDVNEYHHVGETSSSSSSAQGSSDSLPERQAERMTYEKLPPQSRAPTFAVKRADAEMPVDSVDLVRSIMASMTLPSEAIPAWANVVAEEDWLPRIVYKD